MSKLIKQLPLVALLLAFTVFVGKAAVQALSTSSTDAWLYDPDATNPADPANYQPIDPDEAENCFGSSEVCIVFAPPGAGTGPDLSNPTLKAALEQGTPHPDITRGDYSLD